MVSAKYKKKIKHIWICKKSSNFIWAAMNIDLLSATIKWTFDKKIWRSFKTLFKTKTLSLKAFSTAPSLWCSLCALFKAHSMAPSLQAGALFGPLVAALSLRRPLYTGLFTMPSTALTLRRSVTKKKSKSDN